MLTLIFDFRNVSEGFSIATYAFYSQNDYRTSYVGDTAMAGRCDRRVGR